MAISSRGSSFQVSLTHQGKRYRYAFQSMSKAQQWEAGAKACFLRGEIPPEPTTLAEGRLTLKALFDLTYRRYWARAKSEDSARRNGLAVVEILGPEKHPAEVDEEAIDELIFRLEDIGNAGSTINRKLAALSKMLTFAVERGYITTKPKIERKEESPGRVRWFTDDEELKILSWCFENDQYDLGDIYVFLVDSGLRRGEALKLDWSDVADGEWIHVLESKSGHTRDVPMTSRIRSILKKRVKRMPAKPSYEELVFGGVFNISSLRYAWNSMRQALAFNRDEHFVVHTCRHTFCSRLVQRGVDIRTVKELAGHECIETTLRYSHLAPDNLVQAMKALDECVPQPVPEVCPSAQKRQQNLSRSGGIGRRAGFKIPLWQHSVGSSPTSGIFLSTCHVPFKRHVLNSPQETATDASLPPFELPFACLQESD